MIALLMAAAAVAAPGSYKLILAVNDVPVVIDYPSLERCERARLAAIVEINRRLEEARASRPDVMITKPGISGSGICIPG